jgi:hypothetical protein
LANKKKKINIKTKDDLKLFSFSLEEKNIISQLNDEQFFDFCVFFNLFKKDFLSKQLIFNYYHDMGISNTVIGMISNLIWNKSVWNNVDITKIRLKSRNTFEKQMELINILFGKYKVPTAFYCFWNKSNNSYRNILINLLQGSSLKNQLAGDFFAFLKLTSKEIHLIWSSKINSHSFEELVIKVLLNRYNSSPRMKKEILYNKNFIYKIIEKNNFYLFVDFVSYMSKQEMFDFTQLFPLWDYVVFKNNQMKREGKKWELKRLNINNLYAEMLHWHEHVSCDVGGKTSWENTNSISPYLEEVDMLNFKGFFKIIELKNIDQLREEGQKMKHCVASYARRCYSGDCSIWSLRKEDSNTKAVKRLITIEVDKNLRIVQVRGVCNRKAEASEYNLIELWARQNGLSRLG